jgi:hypothetical protein
VRPVLLTVSRGRSLRAPREGSSLRARPGRCIGLLVAIEDVDAVASSRLASVGSRVRCTKGFVDRLASRQPPDDTDRDGGLEGLVEVFDSPSNRLSKGTRLRHREISENRCELVSPRASLHGVVWEAGRAA